MANNKFQEQLAMKILRDSTIHHFAGLENAHTDGDMTAEELLPMFDILNFIEYAGEELSRSMEKGAMLESPMDNLVMESKHLKFLGTDALQRIKTVAGVNAWSRFSGFVEQLKEEAK